jgi:hypothetical protein
MDIGNDATRYGSGCAARRRQEDGADIRPGYIGHRT